MRLKKTSRQLNDGLGTVRIDFDLSQKRLDRLQQKADSVERSVDAILGDAILEYLVRIDRHGFTSLTELYEKVDEGGKSIEFNLSEIRTIILI